MKPLIYEADCVATLAGLPDACVHAIVTDPPYGLGFMGKKWDDLPPGIELMHECLRVLKPGGHLLAFGGTRTYHRLACAIEDAGFEIRDCLAWLYGSGFPKSHDVSKAIDKAAGATRGVVGLNQYAVKRTGHGKEGVLDTRGPGLGGIESAQVTAPATPDAERWQGWGTALKPAHEPIVLARKPLIGTVAANVLAHDTGALNVDGCRIAGANASGHWHNARSANGVYGPSSGGADTRQGGRWPANVLLDPEAAALLGGASRFFYCAKASSKERNAGLDGFEARQAGIGDERPAGSSWERRAPEKNPNYPRANVHPTVKPVELMRWLVRLVTPPGGIVLDPFMGSGTTGIACALEGLRFVGIEREADYVAIARARLAHWEVAA